MAFARFMATPAGRLLRVGIGLALVIGGTLVAGMSDGTAGALVGGIAIAVVGAVLVTVGAANVCPLAVPFGGPFDGRKVTPREHSAG